MPIGSSHLDSFIVGYGYISHGAERFAARSADHTKAMYGATMHYGDNDTSSQPLTDLRGVPEIYASSGSSGISGLWHGAAVRRS